MDDVANAPQGTLNIKYNTLIHNTVNSIKPDNKHKKNRCFIVYEK